MSGGRSADGQLIHDADFRKEWGLFEVVFRDVDWLLSVLILPGPLLGGEAGEKVMPYDRSADRDRTALTLCHSDLQRAAFA